MIPLKQVNWGPTDSLARDKHFADKWTEPDEIKNCLASDNWLISGEKGSGKSAIRRALIEIYGERYLVSPVVDFNDLSFKALYEHIVQLASTTKLSKTATLSHFWQYALIIELLVTAAHKAPEKYGDLLEQVPSARAAVPLNQRLMQLLEESWNKIDDFTGMKPGSKTKPRSQKANLIASAGLTASLLHQLSKFPLGQEYDALKKSFFSRIEDNGDRLVLILDGFDRLRNDGTNSNATRLIFASLVDAIQVIHTDANLPEKLEMKAFIPHDRYLALPLRDSDKIDTMHVAIRWTRSSLQEFLKKRLEITPKLAQGNFTTLWRQVMPESVLNSQYKISEDTFDYIVRHSMFRPRQVQIHLEHLASKYPDQNIDPTMVPNSIAESSKNIANYFIEEFRTDHPNFGRFIHSLNKKDNIMEYVEFKRIVADAIERFHSADDIALEDKIDMLYAMGVFGVLNFVEPGTELGAGTYYPPTKESKRHYVDFFFKSPHPAISATLQDTSLIALHPVFVDSAGLRPHSSLIVG